MDFKMATETLVSLIILVFVLAALRKVIMFFASKYGLDGIASFLD